MAASGVKGLIAVQINFFVLLAVNSVKFCSVCFVNNSHPEHNEQICLVSCLAAGIVLVGCFRLKRH